MLLIIHSTPNSPTNNCHKLYNQKQSIPLTHKISPNDSSQLKPHCLEGPIKWLLSPMNTPNGTVRAKTVLYMKPPWKVYSGPLPTKAWVTIEGNMEMLCFGLIPPFPYFSFHFFEFAIWFSRRGGAVGCHFCTTRNRMQHLAAVVHSFSWSGRRCDGIVMFCCKYKELYVGRDAHSFIFQLAV